MPLNAAVHTATAHTPKAASVSQAALSFFDRPIDWLINRLL